jgi:hypothetical protein
MLKPRLASDYDPKLIGASFSVLLEVMTVLKSYQDALVLIGGWVPFLTLRDHGPQNERFDHVGSIDIDLAVDPTLVDEDRYETIVNLLQGRGYTPDPDSLFRFNRQVPGASQPIGIDFMTSEPPAGEGKAHRHREVQSKLKARATPYMEIAFKHFTMVKIEGELPENGGLAALEIKMADLPAIFSLKGHALGARYKEKDAYDIYAMARYYGRGVKEVIELLKPHAGEPALKKGLENIREKFESDKHTGPAWVANFLAVTEPEERARVMQDAYQTMDAVLKGCGM